LSLLAQAESKIAAAPAIAHFNMFVFTVPWSL
jgi:hypothetical protein